MTIIERKKKREAEGGKEAGEVLGENEVPQEKTAFPAFKWQFHQAPYKYLSFKQQHTNRRKKSTETEKINFIAATINYAKC